MQINKCSMKKYDPEVIIDSLSLFSVCCTVSRHWQKKGLFRDCLNAQKGIIP